MKLISTFLLCIVGPLAYADHELHAYNNCPFTVWPGLYTSASNWRPENGGFQLNQGETHVFSVPDSWNGRIWGRTNCGDDGNCETGDCGPIQCNGATGVPPASLAEFNLSPDDGGMDFYDVSLVDGYNIPMSVYPLDGTFNPQSGSQYDCTTTGCHGDDVNGHCPDELAVRNSDGSIIACKSSCLAFGGDQYCCTGAYASSDSCQPSDWPVNSAAVFKQSCPDAYSYAFDDATSTFTCHGNPKAGYVVQFCPSDFLVQHFQSFIDKLICLFN